MMIKNLTNLSFLLVSFTLIFLNIECGNPSEKKLTKEDMIKRGAYLVSYGGCNECHTPKIYTDLGPVYDTTKLLSGHQTGLKIPKVDTSLFGDGKWYLGNSDQTAWIGPWGISFASNLTPDSTTGMGMWTDEIFIRAMRNGLHLGADRPLLPPMPFASLAGLSNDDLESIFAYLKSINAVKNNVPDPIPPHQVTTVLGNQM